MREELNIVEMQKIKNWAESRLLEFAQTRAGKDKYLHSQNVCSILKEMGMEENLADMLGLVHDTGRVEQLKLLGGFKDNIILHHYLGEDAITRALYKGELDDSYEVAIARTVMQFHGRSRFMLHKNVIDDEIKEINNMVSIADDIENGCAGAVTYLLAEKEEDVKGYAKAEPAVDQKTVTPEVWEYYKNGEKFDKMKYCKTYADYFLFAAVLAIQVLKGEYREIAKNVMDMPAGNYSSAIEGYEDILGNHVEEKYAKEALEILKSYL